MKYLLDSHIILWALTDYEVLPDEVQNIIFDEENEIYYSLASLWEVTIKWINNPKRIPISGKIMAEGCEASGYHYLPILKTHVDDLPNLKKQPDSPRHADPFDRILVCQA